jgi:DNA-binding NarL/FixJ family response regulator
MQVLKEQKKDNAIQESFELLSTRERSVGRAINDGLMKGDITGFWAISFKWNVLFLYAV